MGKREVTVLDILTAVAKRYGLTVEELCSGVRAREPARDEATLVAYLLVRMATNLSFRKIAALLRKAGASTVRLGVGSAMRRIRSDEDFETVIRELQTKLGLSDYAEMILGLDEGDIPSPDGPAPERDDLLHQAVNSR